MEMSKERFRETVLDALHKDIVVVEFTKVTGEKRVMRCTLAEDDIPEAMRPVDEGMGRENVNPDIINVWDIEKQDWRAFRINSVDAVNGQAVEITD